MADFETAVARLRKLQGVIREVAPPLSATPAEVEAWITDLRDAGGDVTASLTAELDQVEAALRVMRLHMPLLEELFARMDPNWKDQQ